MLIQSPAFGKLLKLALKANTLVEDDDVETPTKYIAWMLGVVPSAHYNAEIRLLRSNALLCLGGLTQDEWDQIRYTMLGNISLLTTNTDFKSRRIDWVRDLDTIYALGEA